MTTRITLAGLCLTLAALANAQSIVVFQVPGASTSPEGILPTGEIVGNWTDAGGNTHGFIRGTNGGFTAFDVPGASSTIVSSFNAGGTICGRFTGGKSSFIGYLHSRSGAFPTFALPDGGSNPGQGTFL